MDSLLETIAAWPVWVWLTAYAVIGQACYIVLLFRSDGSDGTPEAMVTLIWPVWLPALLPYLAIRRVVRWVRARRAEPFSVCDAICASMEQEPAKWRMTALTLDGPKGWSLWNDAACSSWQMYRGGIKFSHKERRRIGQAARAWTVRRVTPATEASKDQPRPIEKSAPYVLDTSREIRELRERVEKLEQGRADVRFDDILDDVRVTITSEGGVQITGWSKREGKSCPRCGYWPSKSWSIDREPFCGQCGYKPTNPV